MELSRNPELPQMIIRSHWFFTVEAEDGSKQQYTVEIAFEKIPECFLLSAF
mgnify:CR=1 FL=1